MVSQQFSIGYIRDLLNMCLTTSTFACINQLGCGFVKRALLGNHSSTNTVCLVAIVRVPITAVRSPLPTFQCYTQNFFSACNVEKWVKGWGRG